jgi:hypothetical protein
LARTAAGLPKFGFHDCRHFFISMAVMVGIDYMTIAKWVGHQDGGILIGKVYGHLTNEHARRQADKLVLTPVKSDKAGTEERTTPNSTESVKKDLVRCEWYLQTDPYTVLEQSSRVN